MATPKTSLILNNTVFKNAPKIGITIFTNTLGIADWIQKSLLLPISWLLLLSKISVTNE